MVNTFDEEILRFVGMRLNPALYESKEPKSHEMTRSSENGSGEIHDSVYVLC
jgi:hypothetical protein